MVCLIYHNNDDEQALRNLNQASQVGIRCQVSRQ